MNQDQQIDKLNCEVKTCLGPSMIQGIGVFALRDIPKGTKLYADNAPAVYSIPFSSFGKLFPEIQEQLLGQWPQIVNGSKFAYPTCRFQAYMNHNTEPNYDAMNDITLKDIAKGEEITEDYRDIPNWQKVFPTLLNWSIDKK